MKRSVRVLGIFIAAAALFFLAAAATGCNDSGQNFDELRAALAKTVACENVSADLAVNVTVGTQSQRLKIYMARSVGDGEEMAAISATVPGSGTVGNYFWKGYELAYSAGSMSAVRQTTLASFWGDSSADVFEGYDDLDCEVTKKETDAGTEYAMKIKDKDFIAAQLASIGTELPDGFDASEFFNYKYTVGASGYVEKYAYDFSTKVQNQKISVTATGYYFVNDDVTVIFPAAVESQFEYYFSLMGIGGGSPGPVIPEVPVPPDPVVPEAPSEPDVDLGKGHAVTPIPAPSFEDYTDTADGMVSYYDLGAYVDAVYDSEYGYLIAARAQSIDVYDRDMRLVYTYEFLLDVAAIDCDGGLLAVGFGDAYKFCVYDLSDFSLKTKVSGNEKVWQIAIDGDTVIYADSDQWCSVVFCNIETQEKRMITSVYQPLLELNRRDHRLYVCETGLSSSALLYFNSQTGEKLFESYSYQFGYNYDPVIFDGNYVHYYGQSFDRFTGKRVSSNGITRDYAANAEFAPFMTVISASDADLVNGTANGTTPAVAVYDNAANDYVYSFPFYLDRAEYAGSGKFVLFGKTKNCVAVAELGALGIITDAGMNAAQDKNTLVVSADGKLKTLRTAQSYDLSATNGDYVCAVNSYGYKLFLYDAATLDCVGEKSFTSRPACVDMNDDRIVVGMGDRKTFVIVDLKDMSSETVTAQSAVFTALFYKDKIVYAPVDQHCDFYEYDMTAKTHRRIFSSAYYPTAAIDERSGMLYIGERNSSSCDLIYFDLVNETLIYRSPFYAFGNVGLPLTFDGAFVHYAGKSFDAANAECVSSTDCARLYPMRGDYAAVTTVYDDGELSVFTGYKDGTYRTVVYDLIANEIVYTAEIYARSAAKTNGAICLTTDIDLIYRLDLVAA